MLPPKKRGERCMTSQKTAAKVTTEIYLLVIEVLDFFSKLTFQIMTQYGLLALVNVHLP